MAGKQDQLIVSRPARRSQEQMPDPAFAASRLALMQEKRLPRAGGVLRCL